MSRAPAMLRKFLKPFQGHSALFMAIKLTFPSASGGQFFTSFLTQLEAVTRVG